MSDDTHELLIQWIKDLNSAQKECFRKIEKNSDIDMHARVEILEKINSLMVQQSDYKTLKDELFNVKRLVEKIERFRIQIMVAVPIASIALSALIPYIFKHLFD